MYNYLKIILLALINIGFSQAQIKQSNTRFVNPMIGTAGNGHTFPGATTPFGMVQLSPDTYDAGWAYCAGYQYADSSIMGFSHTHLSGTGRADLCDLLFMPSVGSIKTKPGSREKPDEGYRSRFKHTSEQAAPGYYAVKLDDYKINAELTATTHCGMHRYTFPASNATHILIDLNHGIGKDRGFDKEVNLDGVITFENDSTISGFKLSSGWAYFQPLYFVAVFSKPFKKHYIAINDELNGFYLSRRGKHIKSVVSFETNEGETIEVKVGISAVSLENAKANLKQEIPNWDFDAVRQKAETAWAQYLDRIDIDASHTDKQIFYTALYHTLIAPNTISDVGGTYLGPDHKTYRTAGNYLSTFSLWDTYRAANPLYTLIAPEKTKEMLNSMLLHFKHHGLLPMWALWGNETICMIGNHAVPVIADAYLKGLIARQDLPAYYEAVKASMTKDHERSAWAAYDQYGYIPYNSEWQSVSKTLELAYNNWCTAQLAKAMNNTADATYFEKRAIFYKNVFDPTTKFMRGKSAEGQWRADFDALNTHNPDYTEGNAWQWNWYVPHDVDGLVKLMGGKQVFLQKLDSLFAIKTVQPGISQDVTGLIGQYAHGNEPSHHIAYLYAMVGKPAKTQSLVHQIINTQYSNQPDGLTGNEDCGQMSAWYMFSALGFYPVNPADGRYIFGSPVIDQATIKLDNGQTFRIRVKRKSKKDIYIKSIRLNGKLYNKPYLTHDVMRQGGELEFEMKN